MQICILQCLVFVENNNIQITDKIGIVIFEVENIRNSVWITGCILCILKLEWFRVNKADPTFPLRLIVQQI